MLEDSTGVAPVEAPVSSNAEPIVSFKGVSKSFGDNKANDTISFDLLPNEVHAVLGENGAGKSTLMSILFGLYGRDEGEIVVRGRTVHYRSARDASIDGIAMLPQHFKLIENMTVLENVMLGKEVRRGPFLDTRGARQRLLDIMADYNLDLDPSMLVDRLSVSDKQRVEILKILWTDAEIIVLDEPTSILTPQEITKFLELVLDFKKRGKTVVIITHKLDEVKKVADRFTVLRRGKFVFTGLVASTSEKSMAQMMVGRQLDLRLSSIPRAMTVETEQGLAVSDIFLKQKIDQKPLQGITFDVPAGRILGIAAVAGNGQSELFKVIGGMISPEAGEVFIKGEKVTDWSVKRRYSSIRLPSDEILALKGQIADLKVLLKTVEKEESVTGELFTKEGGARSGGIRRQINHFRLLQKRKLSYLAHIPEDRHEHGLVLDFSCAENAVLQDIDNYRRFGLFLRGDANAKLDYLIRNYDVRGVASVNTPARVLSGGNQQKLILGREIERQSSVLLAFSPTRGLDVGSTRRVYEQIMKQRDNGTAVLLYSGELDEIMDISDEIAIMHNGAIVGIVKARDINKDEVGIAMFTGQMPEKMTARSPIKYYSQNGEEETKEEDLSNRLPVEEWMNFHTPPNAIVPLLPEKVTDTPVFVPKVETSAPVANVVETAVKTETAKVSRAPQVKKAKRTISKAKAKRPPAKKARPAKAVAKRKAKQPGKSKKPALQAKKRPVAKQAARSARSVKMYKLVPVKVEAPRAKQGIRKKEKPPVVKVKKAVKPKNSRTGKKAMNKKTKGRRR